jgi:hypothetical protein
VQRILVVISSGIAQSIKFACIFFGMLAWPARKIKTREKSTDTDSASNSGNVIPFASNSASHSRLASNVGGPDSNSASDPSNVTNGRSNSASDGMSNSSKPASDVSKTPEKSNAGIASNSVGNSSKPARPQKCSLAIVPSGARLGRADALKDLRQLIAERGERPPQVMLSKRWRVPQTTVSSWVRAWSKSGEIAKQLGEFVTLHEAGTA